MQVDQDGCNTECRQQINLCKGAVITITLGAQALTLLAARSRALLA